MLQLYNPIDNTRELVRLTNPDYLVSRQLTRDSIILPHFNSDPELIRVRLSIADGKVYDPGSSQERIL